MAKSPSKEGYPLASVGARRSRISASPEEGLRLLNALTAIADPAVREALIKLAEALAQAKPDAR